jgi:hypothetical protein
MERSLTKKLIASVADLSAPGGRLYPAGILKRSTFNSQRSTLNERKKK